MGKRRGSVLSLVGVLSALLFGLLPSPSLAASAEDVPAFHLETKAKEIEAELAQAPRSEGLLAELTRTRIKIADATSAGGGPVSKEGVDELRRQLASAYSAWSRYLKVAKKPSPGLAALAAPSIFQAAEISLNAHEAFRYVKAAAAAQQIVTASRPSKDSWATLSFYESFAQHYKAADEEIEKALTYAKTEFERKSLEKQFDEVEKDARQFGEELG